MEGMADKSHQKLLFAKTSDWAFYDEALDMHYSPSECGTEFGNKNHTNRYSYLAITV